MTTTILILCFSAVTLVLVMGYLARSTRQTERTNERTIRVMETLIRQSATTVQSLSGDLSDTVTKALRESHQTIVDLYLGREGPIPMVQTGSESERPLTPGIETYEGLPTNVVEALQREEAEQSLPDWRIVSSQPNSNSAPNGPQPTPNPSPSPTRNPNPSATTDVP